MKIVRFKTRNDVKQCCTYQIIKLPLSNQTVWESIGFLLLPNVINSLVSVKYKQGWLKGKTTQANALGLRKRIKFTKKKRSLISYHKFISFMVEKDLGEKHKGP
jgi:hypothetical protein